MDSLPGYAQHQMNHQRIGSMDKAFPAFVCFVVTEIILVMAVALGSVMNSYGIAGGYFVFLIAGIAYVSTFVSGLIFTISNRSKINPNRSGTKFAVVICLLSVNFILLLSFVGFLFLIMMAMSSL